MANELPPKTEKKPEPNIAFVGDEGTKPLVNIQSAHPRGIRLPEDQSKPFYHEKAQYIIRNFGHLYKTVKGKGDK